MARRINYLQRLVGTAVGFVSFGLGGLVFALLVVPGIWVLCRNPQRRAAVLRKNISRSFRFHVNMLRFVGVLDYRLHNGAALESGQLIVANHPTLLDVVFLVGFIENAVCVVKDKLFHNVWVGFVIRMANYVSNSDPQELIEGCMQALNHGESVIIFPEGTRSVPGQTSQLQRGAAYVALHAQKPLMPIHITCVPSSLTKAQAWYEIPPSKMQFDFVVGTELEPTEHYDTARALGARRVNQDIMRVLFS